jgi:hypothetical protein
VFPKILGILFIVSSVIEISYFFALIPEANFAELNLDFIAMLLMALFTVLSFSLGYGLFKSKAWGYNYSLILIIFRIILLGYLAFSKDVFFVLIIVLDIIMILVMMLSKPLFVGVIALNEKEALMQEVEAHKLGKDKKEIWE